MIRRALALVLCVSACDLPQAVPPMNEADAGDDGGAQTDSDGGPSTVVASLTLSVPFARARVGDEVSLGVEALDARGQPIAQPRVRFTISDEYVFVMAAGTVGRALKEGTVTITATANGVTSNQVSLEILPSASAGLFTVRFTEQRVVLKRGAVRRFVAEVRDASGNLRPETNLALRLEPATGCCTELNGQVTATAAGAVELVARSPEGAEGRLPITVVDADQVLEVDWVGEAASIAADRQVRLEWTVRLRDLSSATNAGFPVVADTLELFDGQTKLRDLTLAPDGGLPSLDVSTQPEGAVLKLSVRATRSTATASSRVREVVVRHARDAGWAPLGSSIDDDAWEHSLAVDPTGRPWVAYRRESNAIIVSRYNAAMNRWDRAARSVNAPNRPSRAELVAMDAGRQLADGGWPMFREEVDSLNAHVFSVQYNYWPRLNATNPSLVIDSAARPIVTFGEDQPEPPGLGGGLSSLWDIRVKRLETGAGATWAFLGGSVDPVVTDDCRIARVAVDPMSNQPVVAFGCADTIVGTFAVDVMAWDDATRAWSRLGTRLPASPRQREVTSLAFESAAVLRVTLDEEGVARTWRMTRAGVWTLTEGAPVSRIASGPAQLGGAGSTVGDLQGFLSSGAGWSRLGNLLDEKPLALAVAPQVTLAEPGAPAISWLEGDPRLNLDLHVSKWNPATLQWERLGARLDAQIDSMVLYHSLAAGPDGGLVVSWSELQSNGTPRLRAVRK
jgi:hypothetical protein